jgi:hypothetical protein
MLKGQYVSMNSNIYKFRDSLDQFPANTSPKKRAASINSDGRSVSAACIFRQRAASSDMRKRNLLNEVGSNFRARADKDHDEESRVRASQKYLIQSFKTPSRQSTSEKLLT